VGSNPAARRNPSNVQDAEFAPAKFDQPVSAQALQRAVGVDRRHCRRVGQLILGQRGIELFAAGQTDHLQSLVHFAHQLSDPLIGGNWRCLAPVARHFRI
jgi:hypothetical protein